ncbi:hemerythrin domain-containing protein [Propionivibrio sp.]|uniref:hemerythrin domain-containing protein n=1 Tax=Propionivibrio sp. TaxID=2212460 RepID=UPI003BF44701
MESIRDLMTDDHRQCDDCFVAVEQSVASGEWGNATTQFDQLRDAMRRHFAVEESILFPAFEARTGMSMGPTQVMRGEHAQMKELMAAAGDAMAARDADDYSGYAETLLIMMQQHNMKEENILYPMCDQHLAAQLETLVPQLERGINATEPMP